MFYNFFFYVCVYVYIYINCSQGAGEATHHAGEEDAVRDEGEGGADEAEPPLLYPPLLHLPGHRQTL